MKCPLCEHPQTHRHGKISKGSQRYRCPNCQQTFTDTQVWHQTVVTTRLVVSYFNWVWYHSRLQTTAAQRAGLATHRWSWDELVSYPTLL